MNKNQQISQNAMDYVKKNYKELIKKFVGENVVKKEEESISIFMAGSPGAGKTEISKNLMEIIGKSKSPKDILRIDPDEIRNYLPNYNGTNANLFQAACSIGVEKIHDFALKKNLDFVLDGTFSNYSKACSNIERSVNKNREISVIYVYQDPLIAWGFTKKREKLEGRRVPKKSFIDQLFLAKENINKIKNKFGNKIVIYLIEKNLKTKKRQFETDINDIDKYIQIEYTEKDLNKLIT